MSDGDLLRAIEAEMQAHRDALARLGRVKSMLLNKMQIDTGETGRIIARNKRTNVPPATA